MSADRPGAAVHLPAEVDVVNVGLSLFADAVGDQGRPVVQVVWRVPGGGRPDVVAALRRLFGPRADDIDRANAEVLRRLDSGIPLLSAVQPADTIVPALAEGRRLLHSGPPLDVTEACDPVRRSMRAAVVAEGWAADPAQADALLVSGEVRLQSANDAGVVVPMATAMGPSTPVWVVTLPEGGTTGIAPLGQGPGDVAWFGKDSPWAVQRLVFLREAVGPVLAEAVGDAEPIDVMSIAAQAVAMGDDVHVRTQAASNLLLRHLLPSLVAGKHPLRVEVARFLSENHLLFLTLVMAAARSLTAWAAQVEGSSVVTSMARNGTEFAVRVGAAPSWVCAPAPQVGSALFHPGRGAADGAPDVGDSAVLELVGLGGAAAAGSPAVAALVGGTSRAVEMTTELDRVCIGRSTRFKLPTHGGRGTPLGVDVRLVVEHGVTPKVTTGILHASDGSGQVGAGVAEAPLSCFTDALLALDREGASGAASATVSG